MRRGALLLAFLLASPARAVLIDSGDGGGNLSAPPDDPGFANVCEIVASETSASYLGDGWVLSAAHAAGAATAVRCGAFLYPPVAGSYHRLQHSCLAPGIGCKLVDLAMWRLAPAPPLPALAIADAPPEVGDAYLLVGNGLSRGTPVVVSGCGGTWQGYTSVPPRAIRWGTNLGEAWSNRCSPGGVTYACNAFAQISTLDGTEAFLTRFDAGLPTAHEAQAVLGDSGGAVFRKAPAGQDWRLLGVAIEAADGSSCGGPAGGALLGQSTTTIANLARYRAQILAVATDTDGDGVSDYLDNCVQHANPSQWNSPNSDLGAQIYGNWCDADLDDDGVVGGIDFNALRACIGLAVGPGVGPPEDPTCGESDMNGDGSVGGPDLNRFRACFGKPLGC